MQGYREHQGEHLSRLRRIEGQVRGLQRMIEDDKYRIDVPTQISAAARALEAVSISLLDEHLRHRVSGGVARLVRS